MTASPLRNFSTTQIEQALSKALSELVGSEFVINISSAKYVASASSGLTGAAERVDLSISASVKPEPFSVEINFVDPDGADAGSVPLSPR